MVRYIKSAGYSGYSMSNNAVDAYAGGEKPISKWTKSDILQEIYDLDYSQDIIDVAKSLPVKALKSIFLYQSSWHHTSKMYNRTDFYSVRSDVTMDDINDYLTEISNKPTEPIYDFCEVEYGEWEGPKRRLKLVEYTDYAIIKDNWAYLYNDGYVKKKKVSGSHFYIKKKYSEIPNDLKSVYDSILNQIAK